MKSSQSLPSTCPLSILCNHLDDKIKAIKSNEMCSISTESVCHTALPLVCLPPLAASLPVSLPIYLSACLSFVLSVLLSVILFKLSLSNAYSAHFAFAVVAGQVDKDLFQLHFALAASATIAKY